MIGIAGSSPAMTLKGRRWPAQFYSPPVHTITDAAFAGPANRLLDSIIRKICPRPPSPAPRAFCCLNTRDDDGRQHSHTTLRPIGPERAQLAASAGEDRLAKITG